MDVIYALNDLIAGGLVIFVIYGFIALLNAP
jgi:hypothetical protein